MVAACLRALTILYLAANSCHLPHLYHFQWSPKVLFFRVGYSPWSFVTSTEPGFNKCLPCQVNLVNTNLALSRPRFSVALWSKHGLTTTLIPRHDPPSDITICMDINPNPGPSSVQDSLNPSRLAKTHLHVTSQCGQSLSYSRHKLLCLRHLAKTTCMSQSTYQMLKSLQIFHYRGKSTGKRKNQLRVLNQPCFDSYANVHAILQVPTEISPHCSRARFEIDFNTLEEQSQSAHYVPKLMVSNVMSLAPKSDEGQEFLPRSDISLAFITETWLKRPSLIVQSVSLATQ